MGRKRKEFLGPALEKDSSKITNKDAPIINVDFPQQRHFLQEIKNVTSNSGVDLIDVMTQLFGVSVDSAYRRLRGVSALSFEEAVELSNYYKISISTLLGSAGGPMIFDYQVLNSMATFKIYLENLLKTLDKVSKEEGHLIYAADDLPIFYHFKHKEHAAFKIFAWLRSVLQLAEFEDSVFDVSLIPADLLELAMELHNTYTKVSSTEIWTPYSADATLAQINRYWQIGLLRKKEQAMQIAGQFIDTIRDAQRMTYRGEKAPGISYRLYESSEPVGTNYVLAKAQREQYCYIRVQSFNTIVTKNDVFCRDAEAFLEFHLNTSTLISGARETARLVFFNNLIAKIEATGIGIRDDDRWSGLQASPKFEF